MSETSPQHLKVLPESWIEAIFTKLSTIYGNRFTDMWRGIDAGEIKKTWAEALVRFSPDSLKHGLLACHDRQYPPNLPEFIDLCRAYAARNPEYKQINAPEPLDRETAKVRLRQACEKAGIKMNDIV